MELHVGMPSRSRIYEFDFFLLDVANRRLTKNGREVVVRPKVLEALIVLVERHGQAVGKDELIEKVWADTTVGDHNLTVTVRALREAIGTEYIETVMKWGYRFAGNVRSGTGELPRPAPLPIALRADPDVPGGAMPLDSGFYVTRPADTDFTTALDRGDSIVLVKGARQVGKTSLLARALHRARENNVAVVLTDFQALTSSAFDTTDRFLRTLAELIADQLDLDASPQSAWNDFLGPSINFERFLRREVFPKVPTSLVWALDETDRLFNFPYASEVFGLFRSWHNLRALDPSGPWHRLTLAIAYATEAHLFITDLNQSPFNVGTRLTLGDFTPEDVADLNGRYGSPLGNQAEVDRFFALTGGHPYLTQCGLYEMVRRRVGLDTVVAAADREEGVFGDALQRMLLSLRADPDLCAAARDFLHGTAPLAAASFYRLRSAGVVTGDAAETARPRCGLYERYLKRRLS